MWEDNGMNFLTIVGALLWIMDSYFDQKKWFKFEIS